MTFTVTYRGADGAMSDERVEAANRAECFAQCRARGIAPLSVKEGDSVSRRERRGRREGWGKNVRAAASAKATPAGGRADRVKGRGRVVACVLSVVLVALVAGGIFWWLGRDEAPPFQDAAEPAKKKISLAKEVKPAIVKVEQLQNISNNNHGTSVDSTETMPPITDGNPKRLTFKQRYGRGRTITNRLNAARARYAVFRHKSENELAVLSCLPVGSPVIGNKEYDEEFMSDLEEALKEKIEIADDDTPEIKKYKEAVIAVKEQIRNLKLQGQDVAAVLTETRRELQDLGVYRTKLERQLADIQREDETLTDQDVADFVAAANQMLEAKGIEPIEFNPLTREIIKRVPFAPAPKDVDD